MEKFGYVMATKMLFDGRRKVHYMYREEGDNPQDSGWRFFCGEEDDEYVNDPDNIGIYDINTILELDKTILPYLNCAAGCALEKKENETTFTVLSGIESSED